MTYSNQAFAKAVADPGNWILKANQLLEAGAVLVEALNSSEPEDPAEDAEQMSFREVGCMGGALLLLGLAVENAFKAVLIARTAPSPKNGRLKRSQFGGGRSGHNLLSLASEIGLTLSDDEKRALKRLGAYTMWLGKYQVPFSEDDYKAAETEKHRVLIYPYDLRLAREFVARAEMAVGGA